MDFEWDTKNTSYTCHHWNEYSIMDFNIMTDVVIEMDRKHRHKITGTSETKSYTHMHTRASQPPKSINDITRKPYAFIHYPSLSNRFFIQWLNSVFFVLYLFLWKKNINKHVRSGDNDWCCPIQFFFNAKRKIWKKKRLEHEVKMAKRNSALAAMLLPMVNYGRIIIANNNRLLNRMYGLFRCSFGGWTFILARV